MDIDSRSVFEPVRLKLGLVFSHQPDSPIRRLVDRRIHIVGARAYLDMVMDEIHQNRTRLLELLSVQRDDDIDDLIGDPLNLR